ncbi:MAG TPA: hypothetical protein VFW31_10375 [Candidatus Angelobacter sp.]|nr:hypothetical protein [Candidatus Angelobacter sp.]
MNKRITVLSSLLAFFISCPLAFSQAASPPASTGQQTASSADKETQEKNISKYIELLRSDIRQDKTEIMGALMQLSAEQAGKFWPIYDEYDKELTRLNNLRAANIQEYARSYEKMSDAKADELIQNALHFQQQRSDLLAKYYGRVKSSIGAVEAARFVQVENQLLLIIDLHIASSLPVVPKEATTAARR